MSRNYFIIALFLCTCSFELFAQQSPCSLVNTRDCAPAVISLNPILPSNRVFCEGDTIRIANNTTDDVDTTFYCWGDGSFTAVAGNRGAFKVYDFPDDTCTSTGFTAVEIKIFAIKRCGTGLLVTNAKFDITILYKPVASFGVTSPVCFGSPTTFSRDRKYCPNGTDVTFKLDYGDGSRADTLPLPRTHTYPNTGNFTATLTMKNSCGTSTFSQNIEVQPLPVIIPTVQVNNRCAPALAQVTANGQFISSTRWTSRNPSGSTTTLNNPNGSFDLTQTGLYTIALEARGCNNRPVTWDTTIRLIGAPSFRLDSIKGDCGAVTLRPSQLLTLTDTTVRNVLWRFSGPNLNDSTNQRSPTDRTFTLPGLYTVSFSATNDCNTTTRSFSFSIDTLRQAQITPVNRLCNSDAPITLRATIGGGQWYLNGTPTTATFNPRTARLGDNLILYTLGNGACQTRDSITIRVNGSIVNAGADVSVCSSEPTIQLPRATPVGGVWRGVGVIDSVNGVVRVNLIASGSSSIRYIFRDTVSGCENFDDLVVRVAALPTATLGSRRNFCINEPFVFNQNGDRTLQYSWRFGDGGTSTEVSPSHTFQTAGNFVIKLTVKTAQGCEDSTSLPIEVGERGNAAFTPANTEGCGPALAVRFTNSSTGSGLSYLWNYGNGQTDTMRQSSTDIVFNQGNRDTVYRIWLRATNSCGADSVSASVLVRAKPRARFGTDFNSNCSPMSVQLSNVSIGQPQTYRWYADGVLFSTDSAPPAQVYRVFNNQSPRTIRLVLVTENGCGIDSIGRNVQVVPPTTRAFFNTDTTIGCVPLRVRLTNYSTVGARVRWSISNGYEDTSQDTLDYTFRTAGIFTVWLYASNGCGYDSTKVQIEVKPAPSVGFQHLPEICLGDSILFRDTSFNTTIGQWSFGDSTFSTARNPQHLFRQSGTFAVQLTAVSLANGCSAIANSQVVVRPLPLVSIGVSDSVGCPPLSIRFDALTTARQVTWFFDSVNTSNQRQPIFQFTSSGRFPIRLLAEDNFGCRNTAIFNNIAVFDKPKAQFSLQTSQLCGLPVQSIIQNTSIGGNDFDWTTNNGQNSRLRTPIFSFNTEGVQTVKLIVENTVGCRDTIQKTVQTYEKPIAIFSTAPNQLCERQIVVFNNLSQHYTTTNWFFGDGASDTTRNVTYRYNQAGTYRPRLIVSNKGICFDTLSMTQPLQVYPAPIADFSYAEILEPKPQGKVQFTNLSQRAISWQWLFAQKDTSIERNPLHTFRLNGTTSVRLAVKSINGCTDTIIKFIPITPFYGIHVPNAFAPNQTDWSEASLFKPKGRGLKTYSIKVFSPFGELLWSSSVLNIEGEPQESWDGMYKGQQMPQGAYTYLLNATYITGENIEQRGTVTLIK